MKECGTVYLVGAGPGDAGLLTLRGAELLRRADVVIYDALVNPALLQHAPAAAEIVFGGRRAKETYDNRGDVIDLLIARARAGKTVVRLKGGDPYVFGRGGEEAERLHEAGVAFEVVPGISAFAAVPNYGGVPLTHRDHCSQLTILTGHDDPAAPDPAVNWAAEAKNPGTKVVMMGTERIGPIAATLMAHGMQPDTPVAMISWGTTGRQQSLTSTLAHIAAEAARIKLPPPTVTVIGDVVKLRQKLNWFEARQLFGRRIVVTRAQAQAAELARHFTELGAEVLEIPCIKIVPPAQKHLLADALLELGAYDWLVFTSPNGVRAFFEYFFKAHADLRELGGARIAAVGPGTAAALRELHLGVDLMPAAALGVEIAREFARHQNLENVKLCLLRAERANPDLPQALQELGAIVDDIPVYATVAESQVFPATEARLREAGADWITFTSGSTVEHFHARFNLPGMLQQFPATRLASIGPETTKALLCLGLKPQVEAKEHTLAGLIAAVTRADRRRGD
ncbi:MAG TPA: uroporphyrinogen-III C-methyltransferase [Verrucomicrobiota bacterium]|nr:uroporphyrinogen-III C-methyltransferase [Verrucomicrobiota bacterium]HNT15241.1 uroporphyrinogen-III C-methyltransferase [Verrucomicrobiota bacterium]